MRFFWLGQGLGWVPVVLRRKLLSAILVVLPATAASTAQNTIVEAASDECRAKPGSAGPPGSRWHYRVNRVDHRRCWFVSSQGGSGHSRPRRTASMGRRHFVSRSRHEVPHVQYDREVNPEMASAQMALPHEQAPLPDFAARWPDLPSSQDLGPRKVATISYARPTTNAPTLPTASVGAKRAVERSSAGEAFNSVFFGGALTATLLVAGGVSYFARRRRRSPRDERHATTEGPDQATHMFARSDRLTGNKWPVQTRPNTSHRQTSPPTVPADDPETGLRDPTRLICGGRSFWGI